MNDEVPAWGTEILTSIARLHAEVKSGLSDVGTEIQTGLSDVRTEMQQQRDATDIGFAIVAQHFAKNDERWERNDARLEALQSEMAEVKQLGLVVKRLDDHENRIGALEIHIST